jgi:adenosylcobinamide kinase/adenosylcobinamide-phosphate guanylyltransferase
LLDVLQSFVTGHDGTAIIVTNEVGLGVVPATPLGRRYRDALGRANQLAAAAADEVTLMVAGLSMPLKA